VGQENTHWGVTLDTNQIPTKSTEHSELHNISKSFVYREETTQVLEDSLREFLFHLRVPQACICMSLRLDDSNVCSGLR
jgi:hypothetical protein